jgi:hypothetical protein
VTRANQQVFGTTSNTYTMPGITSAASAAAQSGPTELVTTDASGNLATQSSSNLGLASMSSLGQQSSRAFTGIAMAFAGAGVPEAMPDERFVLTTSWGTFQGENSAAISAAFRIYRDIQLNGSYAFGFGENLSGGHIGLRFSFK